MWVKNFTPIGALTAIAVNYGYNQLLDIADIDTAKEKLAAYLISQDQDLNKEQADVLASATVNFVKEMGRVGMQGLAARGYSGLGKGVAKKFVKNKKIESDKVKEAGKKSRIQESENSKIKIRIDEKSEKHIFRKAEGHIADTIENRSLLEVIASSDAHKLGSDKYGNIWHARLLEDGTQVWTQIRDGQIINGGINQIPRIFNPETGLSAPTKPN